LNYYAFLVEFLFYRIESGLFLGTQNSLSVIMNSFLTSVEVPFSLMSRASSHTKFKLPSGA